MGDPGAPAGAGRPRLVIARLELENFKSYAGVQQIGPFHKSLSAIVGPNGSGKSNVIDAMLFVFGKRAKQVRIPQLRLSKVSELIHNSTDHQNLKLARVSVYFEEVIDTGPDEYEKVEGSDLVVTRTAQKNNTSEYFVNNKKSSFTEVTTLLKAKGVDLNNNRFLILQGEVEQISLMPPKAEKEGDTGLLEYLEDIIGTNKYIEPIKEASIKLEALTEEKQKQIQRVKTAEKSRNQLEEGKKLAEQYRSKEINFLEGTIKLQMRYKHLCELNVEQVQSQMEELNKKLEHENEKAEQYEQDFSKLKSGAQSAEKAKASLIKRYESAAKKVKELEREATTVKEREQHLQKKIAAAKSAIKANKTKEEGQQQQLSTATDELPEAEATVEELGTDLEEETKKLEDMQHDLQGEVKEVQARLTEARTALAPWHEKMRAIDNQRQLAGTKAELLRKQASAATTRRDEVAADLASSTKELKAEQARVSELEKQQAMHREEAETAKKLAEEAKKSAETAEQAVADAKGAQMGLAAAMDEVRNKGRALQGLLEAQDRGQLKGLFGRLGDLGSIDKQYDAAASNATGALDNLVVDTTVHAQQCVEHLRKHDLGVATFLILEKQANLAREMDRRAQTPEGIPRLFDLVKCSRQELRPAFFYAFRHTLVASDIDQASRIGHGSQDSRCSRVVTMQGELVAENGTMSGGGARVARGRMRLGTAAPVVVDPSQSRAELAAVEERLQRLEQELREFQHAAMRHAERAEAVAKAQDTAAMEFQKSCLAVESGTRKCKELKQQLAQMDSTMKGDAAAEAEVAKLEEVIAQSDADLEAVKQDAAGAELQVAEVQAELDGIGGEPMRLQKDRVETLKQDLKEAEQLVAKQRTLVTTAQKSLKKLASELQKKEQELEGFEADLQALLEGKEGTGDHVQELKKEQEELQKEIKDVKAELEAKQAEVNQVKKALGRIKEVQANLSEALSEQEAVAEIEAAKAQEFENKVIVCSENLAQMLPDGQKPNLSSVETVSEMTDDDAKELEFRCASLEGDMHKLQKDVDLTAIDKFVEKDREYNERKEELDRVAEERNSARDEYEGLRKLRQDDFSAGFKIISDQLKDMYEMITNGGNAELEMVDSMDPFAEGIIFSVRPPKKSWKNITQLSGGEKTLSSLALVFALHHFKPTPLYFMDEIDAALDFKNVSIVAHYVKEQTKHAQFVVISLRNHMFELADHLVGIYKTNNCTKNVTIEPSKFVVNNREERPLLQQQRA